MPQATLADFARILGISPALARQWKRRRKITETDDCWIYCDGENGATLAKTPALSVTLEPQDVTESVTIGRDGVTRRDADVTERDSRGTGWPVIVTPEAWNALLSRVETCERDSVTLQRQVDALRDRCAALEAENKRQTPAGRVLTLPGGPIDPPGPNWGA